MFIRHSTQPAAFRDCFSGLSVRVLLRQVLLAVLPEKTRSDDGSLLLWHVLRDIGGNSKPKTMCSEISLLGYCSERRLVVIHILCYGNHIASAAGRIFTLIRHFAAILVVAFFLSLGFIIGCISVLIAMKAERALGWNEPITWCVVFVSFTAILVPIIIRPSFKKVLLGTVRWVGGYKG